MAALDNPLAIANAALALVGDDAISSFTEDNDTADFVNRTYEACISDALASKRWRFATRKSPLDRLSAAPEGSEWEAAYQIPADCVIVHTVLVDGFNIDFDRYDDKLLCNATVDDVVILDHNFRAHESTWWAGFRSYAIYKFAAELAIGLAERRGLAQDFQNMATGKLRAAASLEAQGRTVSVIDTSKFIRNRRNRWRG